MRNYKMLCIAILLPILVGCTRCADKATASPNRLQEMPIKVSTEYPSYFETAEGKPWIPISTNFLPADGLGDDSDTDEIMFIENYFKKFSANGGNSLRIWISTSFLEVEDRKEGVYNPKKFERIDKLLALAKKYNLLIKFTLQHIRTISDASSPSKGWANSKALATRFTSIQEYVNTPAGRNSYLNRTRALAEKYRDNPQIYGWELWNEMNAVTWDDWEDFTQQMLDSVKVIFPHHLVTQTLGSLDCPKAERTYEEMFTYKKNEFVSLHRYLDPGDEWGQYSQVKGDIDTLVSTLMNFAKSHVSDRPIIYNEVGAVEGSHAGPSKLYPLDKEGILLHDMVFAPFFCGAAGSGSMWHWDHYILKNDLWQPFKSFSHAVKGLDPIKERLENTTFEVNGVRCYALTGRAQTIIWCRDSGNNWHTELVQNILPPEKTAVVIEQMKYLGKQYHTVQYFDPWKDQWTNPASVSDKVNVPAFKRSIVIVLK